MNGSPSLRLRLAGHTDERGSDEYNLGSASAVPHAPWNI
jgi:outer membrane protein OmpA-like peptidoglycan-associated protein